MASTITKFSNMEVEHDKIEKKVYVSDKSGAILKAFNENDVIEIIRFLKCI